MKTYPSMCYERNFASKALGLQNALLLGTLIKTNCGVAQAKKCSSENGVAFCVGKHQVFFLWRNFLLHFTQKFHSMAIYILFSYFSSIKSRGNCNYQRQTFRSLKICKTTTVPSMQMRLKAQRLSKACISLTHKRW